MQTRHVPRIDVRYWCGITCASIFGTNLGDFYAHHSGLGTGLGVLLLLMLFAVVYWIETKDRAAHEIYYWLAIIIIRTGATNIADYLAFRLHIPAPILVAGLAALIALLAWRGTSSNADPAAPAQPKTNLTYWAAMLAAGVFGTVTGDVCSHRFGQGPSSIVLGLLLVLLLIVAKDRAATRVPVYWFIIAVARTAGTCMGDWLAENHTVHLGLSISTLVTGSVFIVMLTAWRGAPRSAANAP